MAQIKYHLIDFYFQHNLAKMGPKKGSKNAKGLNFGLRYFKLEIQFFYVFKHLAL